MISPEEIRLECLKLVHAHSKTADQVIAQASRYENYVVGPAAKGNTLSLPGKAGNSTKRAGGQPGKDLAPD